MSKRKTQNETRKTQYAKCIAYHVLPHFGFTLIELLVVILIVGILMGLSLVGFGATRKSARDSKRKADLEQIRSALEIYRTDCKTYPAAVVSGSALTGGETFCSGNTYMSQVPSDPLSPTRKYAYAFTDTDPNSYVLCASLEMSNEIVVGCGDCVITCNYKVTNP